MAKTRKRSIRQTKNKKRNLLFFFVMLPILALTIFTLLQPQRVMQFAEGFNAPPLFGCLHTGEADPSLCGTRLGQEGASLLKVNGQKFVGQNIYYNDTLSGSFTYKNVGDLPINIANYGIAAGSLKQFYIAEFQPLEGAKTLAPGEILTSKESSYTFKSGDPSDGWVVGPGITNTDGQPLPITQSTNVRVSSACTALRVKTLTVKDKSNIQALCSKDPKNILCTSRQYCEIFKGGQCSGPVLGEARENQQCDEYIVLDQKEQDILEQLCKPYPDSDACKDFCKRAIGSKICPAEMLWFDPNGKQVFPQPAKYMASTNEPAVAGAKVIAAANGAPDNDAGVKAEACIPNGQSGDNTAGCCSGYVDLSVNPPSGLCKAPSPAKPKTNPFPPKPAAPGVDPRSSIGYKPSCPSHRANESGQCCASDFPLINGCCQPGCFVYKSAPATRANCQYKSKSGVCCAKDTVEKFGYCQPSQVPAGKQPLPGESQIPRDTNKIYPPNYKAPADTPPNPNDCTPAERSAGVCGNNPAPANPAPANPAPADPTCSIGDLTKKSDFDCLAKQKGYKATYGACMEPVVIESQACYNFCRVGRSGDLFQQCIRDKGCQTTYDEKEMACR